MRKTFFLLSIAALAIACEPREPLTPKKADEVIRSLLFEVEPVYAEVPQKVWWTPDAPKDEYDGKALQTLRNLEKAGLITVTGGGDEKNATYQAKVTKKGFPILGTMPSMRGPVYRGRICEKRLEGIRNFVPHPSDPTIGSAEVVWHYTKPTPLYALFETKINKPLEHQFVSVVSLRWHKGAWRMQTMVNKAEP